MPTSLSPRSHVETIGSRKIKGFLGTIDEQGIYYDPVHKQNQSLSQHIIADYHGRFLIELVQNGHDALPKDRRDGELAVLLAADEGECGTLYVANRGQPFQPGNVDALCEIGLSSKPPGEAVGNKGLGFRSVRHVSDIPEIFSRLSEGEGDGFDGYRFTFARDADFDALVPDEKTRALARDDLPAFYVPKWIDDPPEGVSPFAAAGFSTVIRLPIRNAGALAAVRDEMVALARAEAPILLFLRRIGKLDLRITGSTLAEDAFELLLTRHETPLPDETGEQSLALERLGNIGLKELSRGRQVAVPRQLIVEEREEAAQRGWRIEFLANAFLSFAPPWRHEYRRFQEATASRRLRFRLPFRICGGARPSGPERTILAYQDAPSGQPVSHSLHESRQVPIKTSPRRPVFPTGTCERASQPFGDRTALAMSQTLGEGAGTMIAQEFA